MLPSNPTFNVPPCTLLVVGLCTAIQVRVGAAVAQPNLKSNLAGPFQLWAFIWEPDLGRFTLSAHSIYYDWQFHRLFSAAFFHAGWVHLILNMMSTLAIQSWLENALGSVLTLCLVVWSAILSGLLSVSMLFVMGVITGHGHYRYSSSLGYSAVLFSMAVVESHLSELTTRSFFGFFSVPGKAYPWILLIVIQLCFPHVSFAGHLGGAISGLLLSLGGAKWIMPSATFVQNHLDPPVRNVPHFVHCPSDPWPEETGSCVDLTREVASGISTAAVGVYQIAVDCFGCNRPGPNERHGQGDERQTLIMREGRVTRNPHVGSEV